MKVINLFKFQFFLFIVEIMMMILTQKLVLIREVYHLRVKIMEEEGKVRRGREPSPAELPSQTPGEEEIFSASSVTEVSVLQHF